MKYAELDDKAKEKARDWLRQLAFTDSSDWDHVYGDAVVIGALLGIDIDNRVVKSIRGKPFDEPDIAFSGFWSQGDGCSFSAQLRVENMAVCVEKVKAHASEDTDLHELAERAEGIHARISAHWVARRLDGHDADDPDNDEYPECGPTMRIAIEGQSHNGFATRMRDDSLCPPEISEDINTFVEDFAGWIYDRLEEEHDHQTDDATLEENILNNAYEFDEDGACA